MIEEEYNWVKHATQTAIDDQQVEKAFMDQAYGFIANKAGELMNDSYRLGFEVVSKNDSNSRMVGIFAFRIDSDLLYAPVFFINGEIKGTDLLYRHDTKTFVPLDEGWVNYMIERSEQGTGKGISKGQRRFMQSDVELQKLITPNFKSASEDIAKATGFASMDDWAKSAAEQKELKPILRDFLLNDAFVPGLVWLEKAASRSIDFAESLVTCCDSSTYAPEGLYAMAEKRAYDLKSEPSKRRFSIHIGSLPEGEKSASQLDEFYKSGTLLIDERDKSEDKMSVVYEDAERNLQQIAGPGLYDVLMADGSMEKAFVAVKSEEEIGRESYGCSTIGLNDSADSRYIVTLADGGATRECSDIVGQHLKDLGQCLEDGNILDSMSIGKSYRIFNVGDGTLSRPVYVKGKKDREGVTSYKVCDTYNSEITLSHNTEFSGSHLKECILGDASKFIEVDAKLNGEYDNMTVNDDVKIGNRSTIEDWLYGNKGLHKMTVEKTASEELVISVDGHNSNLMGPISTTVALAEGFRIPGLTAQSIVKIANEEGKVKFWLETHEKAAGSVMRLADEPDFYTDYDSVHGVEVEQPQGFALNTEVDTYEPDDPRIGDAWDPSSADGLPASMISSTPPEQLEQLAKLHKLPNVFEHGVVGSMANTFDSSSMISKYLPDIEKALDGLGRILFLFYWKPGDFEDAYGTDDMINMENELLSNFKSFGELVLNLLKKTKRNSEGNPPLPS